MPYRISLKERELINELINDMLKNKIIRLSESAWSSPVVLIRKKDGSIRFCVDFRQLNAITENDVYPIPDIEEALKILNGSKVFSSMDVASMYWQIEMVEQDKEKT